MSSGSHSTEQIERLLLDALSLSPFHNLFFLGACKPSSALSGGTCSDKVLACRDQLKAQGVDSRLHSSFISGQETHRLLALRCSGDDYFADVGNGWPSVRLFPANRAIDYCAFGIQFRTTVTPDFVDVYQIKQGDETLSQRIPRRLKPETEILADIEQRFSGGVRYPFASGLRFAQVIGDEFLFLKDDLLRIYSQERPLKSLILPNKRAQVSALKKYFSLDVKAAGLEAWADGEQEVSV